MEGLADLLGRHTLEIPVLDSYSYSVPEIVSQPQQVLEQRVEQAADEVGLPPRYRHQQHDELETVDASGMAGYLLLVAQVTDWLREHGVLYQTRGSAAGSIVCWLLGISNVDPIKWDLRFERFLSKDRTKPPDIDLDIAHDRRDELMAMLSARFTAHQIGSWATYSLNDTEDLEGETQRGSLRVRYYTASGKKDEGASTWDEVPQEDKDLLMRLSERHLYSGMGTNAAGVVLTSTLAEFERLVPMAYIASRKGYVTQYSKDLIEALGLVKLDVLGSKTLTVMQHTMDHLGLRVSTWPTSSTRMRPRTS